MEKLSWIETYILVGTITLSPQRTIFGGGCQNRVGVTGLASRCRSCPPPQRTSGSEHGTDSRPENMGADSLNFQRIILILKHNIWKQAYHSNGWQVV